MWAAPPRALVSENDKEKVSRAPATCTEKLG